MKQYLLMLSVVGCAFLTSCADDEVRQIPADAEDNLITGVVITLGESVYNAVVGDSTITVNIPYTNSLYGATATFTHAESATIIPDPATISDWGTERIFRVTSYMGERREYKYTVIKDEITCDGDVELLSATDVETFVASASTVINGDLIIGSDEADAEELSDISGLELLKQVTGNIILRNSYTGSTLEGLENITSCGGLQLGSSDLPSQNTTLEYVSMEKLTAVTGDISIYGTNIWYVYFESLEKVEGTITVDNATQLYLINMPSLTETGNLYLTNLPTSISSVTLPELTTVNGDLKIYSTKANTSWTSLEDCTSTLKTVKGVLTVGYFSNLTDLSLVNLERLGGISLDYLYALGPTIDLSHVEFIGTGDDAIVNIIQLSVLENIKTPTDLAEYDFYIYDYSKSSSIINTNVEKVKNFTYDNSKLVAGLEMSLSEVYGNLFVNLASQSGVKANDLTFVNGYMYIEAQNIYGTDNNFTCFPSLEEVGGQLYLDTYINSGSNTCFAKLKRICCATEKAIYSELDNVLKIHKCSGLFLSGSDETSTIVAIDDSLFPELEEIGGDVEIYSYFSGLNPPKLTAIDGTLTFSTCSKKFTTVTFPALKKISGLTVFSTKGIESYEAFAPFILDGQITEENWNGLSGYTPTYQQMLEGIYSII